MQGPRTRALRERRPLVVADWARQRLRVDELNLAILGVDKTIGRLAGLGDDLAGGIVDDGAGAVQGFDMTVMVSSSVYGAMAPTISTKLRPSVATVD